MFGIKDLFTTINLMGGVVAMAFCVDGKPFEAGLAIMIGALAWGAWQLWRAQPRGASPGV